MNAELLDAIIADPDDESLRLVYADWCEERGDPRADFIRVQLELAKPEPPNRTRLLVRQADLRHAHRRRWNGELYRRLIGTPLTAAAGRRQPIRGWTYRRGFVEAVRITPAALDAADTLRRLGPIRSVHLVVDQQPVDWGAVLDYPLLGRLRELVIASGTWMPLSDEDSERLADSPLVRQLDRFRLRCVGEWNRRFQQLFPDRFAGT